ncbi:tellurite resistance/C4-dicarboxylate transporter family protein [Streptomyces sp. NBC_01808]|uniref:tellurite resistance/C4-dicarboxylate transporter family protein n=1 Tax=Streptomyces sp. NBC_01808 TaxID=2975947 RepID=UPI002DDA4358|nr:tellurite resistance/C4-dicarboxylate transporter family protein [Streptomyces sp. NBC_01808]WSA42269.1 tellurite resistance/C4-dicarboxylate transporter family protein [Streptomyces sp. NBC_01808]
MTGAAARIRARTAGLAPGCFAPVMATGIVSRALDAAGAHRPAVLLLAVAAAAFVPLLAGTALRAVHHRDRLAADLAHPARAFGAFTLTAAAGVLATRLADEGARPAALALLAVAAPGWALAAAGVLRMLRRHGRTALARTDGTWFLATVGLQSLTLTVTATLPGPAAAGLACALWLAGLVLYGLTLAAVAHRLRHHPPGAAGLGPAYWITMGAVAISLLAGARLQYRVGLLRHGPGHVLLPALWLWATALLPVLLAAGAWRHLHRRRPLRYEPALWCIVFPAGMYATATAALDPLPRPFTRAATVCALAAWTAVTALLLHHRATAPARLPVRP